MGDDDGGKEGGETEQEKTRRTIPDRARFLVWMVPSLSTPGVCLQQRISLSTMTISGVLLTVQ